MKRLGSTLLLCLAISAILLSVPHSGLSQDKSQPAQKAAPTVNCPRPDAEIEKEIVEKMKADPKLKNHIDTILVTSKNGIVKVKGRVLGGPAAVRKVVELASSVPCVKGKVNVKELSTQRTSGCDPDTEVKCSWGCEPKSRGCGRG